MLKRKTNTEERLVWYYIGVNSVDAKYYIRRELHAERIM